MQLRLKQIDGVVDGALDLQVVQWDNVSQTWKPGRKNNVTNVDPTVNDDIDLGYEAGSLWVNTTTKNAFICTDPADGVAVWVGLAAGGAAYSERVVTENVVGADTTLADALAYEPVSDASVSVYLNGQHQEQGVGKDYVIDHGTTPPKITWLALTGTAVDMDTSDVLVVNYETLGI